MGAHDDYGKRVLQLATDGAMEQSGCQVEVDYGAGLPARIDAAVAGNIAIEVESRTSKQVRGAVLDLICHPYPKKLLLLLPVHMANPEVTAKQSENILARFFARDAFIVLLLRGSGDMPNFAYDVALVKNALAKLGFCSVQEQPRQLGSIIKNPMDEASQLPSQSQQAGGKYGALERHLRALTPATRELVLTFKQIEDILGNQLPPSAFKHREWWSNQKNVSNRPQAKAWINAGFRAEFGCQDRQNAWVKFVRQ